MRLAHMENEVKQQQAGDPNDRQRPDSARYVPDSAFGRGPLLPTALLRPRDTD